MMSKSYFLIINEDYSSGLIQTQFIKPVKKALKDSEYKFIWIKKIYSKKAGKEKNLISIPLGIPYKLFLFRNDVLLTKILAKLYALILCVFMNKNDRLIVRSYFPALVAYYVFRIKGIKFYFDTRSLFINENMNGLHKKIDGEDSGFFKNWFRIEQKLLFTAERVFCVSYNQIEYYLEKNQNLTKDKFYLNPCIAEDEGIKNQNLIKEAREDLGYKKDDVAILYYGSLDNAWNNIDMYSEIFRYCSGKGYKICIMSQDKKKLQQASILKNIPNLNIVSVNDFTNPGLVIQAHDYGMIIMKKNQDWKTRLGVKYVKYLLCGLRPIVGEWVGEAKRYTEEYFLDDSIVYKNLKDLDNLNRTKYQKKIKIYTTAIKLFNEKRFVELINSV